MLNKYNSKKQTMQNTAKQNYPGSCCLLWQSARKRDGWTWLLYNTPQAHVG